MAKHSLKDRLKSRYENRSSSNSRVQALNFKSKEVKFFKPKKGNNFINILPYTIATKNHPLVRSGDAEVGEEDFVLDLWIHQYVGPNKSDIICPKRNFNKPCPICEAGDEYRDQGKKDESSKCRPSHRAFYNIVDTEDDDSGVQIFSTSFKNFHEELMNEAGDAGKDEENSDSDIIDFIDFKNGKVVKFRAEEESYNKNKYFEFKSFKFQKRTEPIGKEIRENIFNLDEYMVIHSYDEIKSAFFGNDEDEEESEEVVDSEDIDEDEEEAPKAKKSSAKEEEEEEEEPPFKGSKEEDDDDDKKPAKSSSKATDDCPNGLTFGKDCGSEDVCDDCPKWEDCYKAKRALKKGK